MDEKGDVDLLKRRTLIRRLRRQRKKLRWAKLNWNASATGYGTGRIAHRGFSIRRGSTIRVDGSSAGYGALMGRLNRRNVLEGVRMTYLMEDAQYVNLRAELEGLKADPFHDQARLLVLEDALRQRAEQLERERDEARKLKELMNRQRQDELARKQGVIEAMRDAATKKKAAAEAEAMAKADAAARAKQKKAVEAEKARVKKEVEVLKRRAQIRMRTGRGGTAVSDDEYQILKRHFSQMDSDNSGEMDQTEFLQFYKNIGGDVLSKKELLDLFNELDADGGGQLSLDEFVKVYAKLTEAEMKKKQSAGR